MAVTLEMNLTDVKPMNTYDLLPAGGYEVHIINSELKTSKAGNSLLNIVWEVLNGEHEGRHIFDFLMLSGDGQNFGKKKIKSIALAVNLENPNYIVDSEDLHGLPCLIEVTIKEQDDYPPKNEIKSYSPIGTVDPFINIEEATAETSLPDTVRPPKTPPKAKKRAEPKTDAEFSVDDLWDEEE